MRFVKFLYQHSNGVGKRIIIKLCAKAGGAWKSKSLRILLAETEGKIAGWGSYGWESPDINGPIRIGKLCSIGPGVRRIQVNHSLNLITTSPFAFNPVCGWVKSDLRERTVLEVGNDIWIGANAVILPNVTRIGDGAVIGAGSIVTKNVPSYAIVAGNPAKVIRYRFDSEICAQLQASNWWNLPEQQLKDLLPLFDKPEQFIEAVQQKWNEM